MSIRFTLNGRTVEVDPGTARPSLLDVLRGDLGITSAKDGCAPQGQCGCCTVLVDGKARVACVTPVRRIADREVTTLEGLPEEVAAAWADQLGARGGSQCGFCTPGIIVRLEERRRRNPIDFPTDIRRALAAHLCRCTGWQGICEAASELLSCESGTATAVAIPTMRVSDRGEGSEAAAERATLESGRHQNVDRAAILGGGGFAADTAPHDALVAVLGAAGEWVLGESLAEARELSAKVQGRRSTLDAAAPLELPEGQWAATLRTSWVEPAYLETDASWCEPGGEAASPLANAGAFGAKSDSPLQQVARRLADEHGRVVLALWSREDAVRHGPKRPPVAAGMHADGTGTMRVAATGETAEAMVEAIRTAAPGIDVEPVEIPGPPTSAEIRAAGWAEAFCLATAAGADSPLGGLSGDVVHVELETGARASVRLPEPGSSGAIQVALDAGDALDDATLRSYVIGAVHMAAGWVTSEGLAVDPSGEVQDLTIRSFGILPAAALPRVEVTNHGAGTPVAVSDAVFVAAAAAIWRHHGYGSDWPLRTPVI